jgi:peptidoglycan/LPS O-acetylase OafA/YrhL
MISAFTLFASSKVRFATDPLPKLNFYVRRAFRILPLWWAAIALYAHRTGMTPWPSALMYFGFIRYRDGVEPFNMGWSIFVEETFYLLLPFVFARITGLRRALLFTAQMCLVAILWDQLAPKLGVPNGHSFIFQFPLNHWFAVALGIALYQLSREPLFEKLVLQDKSAALVLDAMAAISFYSLVRLGHMAASFGLAVLFIACMSPHTRLGALARNRLLGLFGTYCYSIYLFHAVLLQTFEPHRDRLFAAIGLARATPDVRLFVAMPFFAAACLALGAVSWNAFEKPCIALGKRVNGLLASKLPLAAAENA